MLWNKSRDPYFKLEEGYKDGYVMLNVFADENRGSQGLFFFKFIYFEREGQRERERESQLESTDSTEPDMGSIP